MNLILLNKPASGLVHQHKTSSGVSGFLKPWIKATTKIKTFFTKFLQKFLTFQERKLSKASRNRKKPQKLAEFFSNVRIKVSKVVKLTIWCFFVSRVLLFKQHFKISIFLLEWTISPTVQVTYNTFHQKHISLKKHFIEKTFHQKCISPKTHFIDNTIRQKYNYPLHKINNSKKTLPLCIKKIPSGILMILPELNFNLWLKYICVFETICAKLVQKLEEPSCLTRVVQASR